uniref:Uncharacterized protein n=1 Tax=Anguilla anguilla TaxID=7936 RepID=A0A0E9U5R7_ANGAN
MILGILQMLGWCVDSWAVEML